MTDLIRWRKGEDRGLTQMRREMDRLFDRFSEAWPLRGFSETGRWMPSVDVSETDKELSLIHISEPTRPSKSSRMPSSA